MKSLPSRPRRYLPPLTLVVTLAIVYAVTLAPGLTWANDGSDGGDLIAATATGGIAHPTGYPLYLLLARLFQFLPFGSLAFRTNLMSALATILGAALVYWLVTRCFAKEKSGLTWMGGLIAGYAFGLAPLVWSQAVITEVYALQAFLVLLIIFLYTLPIPDSKRSRTNLDRWCGLLLGFAMDNHITAVFLVPLALLLGSIHWKGEADDISSIPIRWFDRLGFDRRAFYRQLTWFGLGLSLYFILPLRALTAPPVNWGNPVTLQRFWWLVSGQLYQSYYLPNGLAGVWGRVQAWAALLLEQFGLLGLLLGFLGLVVYGRVSRFALFSSWTALVFSVFAIFYRSVDSYIYLELAFIPFAIWIGVGVVGLARVVSRNFPRLGLILEILILGYFLVRGATHFRQVDASKDGRAENFAQEVLSTAPESALIFAKGDQAVFTMWYFHFALRQRPDVVVIATDLLHFDWYQETLQKVYPSLELPGPFPWPETIMDANPEIPVCYVEYVEQTMIDCKPPVNSY